MLSVCVLLVVGRVVEHKYFHFLVGFVLLLNLAALIFEASYTTGHLHFFIQLECTRETDCFYIVQIPLVSQQDLILWTIYFWPVWN